MPGGEDGSCKKCTRCKQVLALTDFASKYRDRGVRLSHCRACQSKLARIHYLRNPLAYKARARASNERLRKRNWQRLREFLATAACLDCGIRDLAALEFDHRDRLTKYDDVGNLLRKAIGWKRIAAEIEKCDVVCANCHRKRTARQFGWYKHRGLSEPVLPLLPERGTPNYEQVKWTRSRLARLHRNRSHVLQYLREHPCEWCGITDPVVLDFDHLEDKRREVGAFVAFSGHAKLTAEIAKCRILCANCHRRHTATQAGRDR